MKKCAKCGNPVSFIHGYTCRGCTERFCKQCIDDAQGKCPNCTNVSLKI